MDEKINNKKRLGLYISKPQIHQDDITIVDTKVARKAVVATALGNAMEWFDFGIYSYLAVIIGKVFFSETSGSLQLVYTFAPLQWPLLSVPLAGCFLAC